MIGGFQPSSFGAATPALDITSAAVGRRSRGDLPRRGPDLDQPATGNAQRSLDATWNAWTGDAGVDWTPDQDTLLYAKYSRGYKAGGFSTFTIAANPETGLETVDAFEVGLKKTFSQDLPAERGGLLLQLQERPDPAGRAERTGPDLLAALQPEVGAHHGDRAGSGTGSRSTPCMLNAQYAHLNAEVNDPGACFEDTVDPGAVLPGANTSGCNGQERGPRT